MTILPRLAAPAALGLLLLAAAPALAQTAAPATAIQSLFGATTLNLSAYGETRIAPDMATLNFGVQTEAPNAEGAMTQNRTRMAQVLATLKRGGIADKDIQTSNLSLNPQYVYVQNQPPKLTGYQASNQVTVTVNDLARIGAAIDAVVSAGANNLGSMAFGLKDPGAAENEARRRAVAALQAEAALYAQATGYRVGRLVSLSEGGGYTPSAPPVPMLAMRMEKADAGTQVQGGELAVRIDITGLYELTR